MTLLVNSETLGKAVAHAMFEAHKDQGDASGGEHSYCAGNSAMRINQQSLEILYTLQGDTANEPWVFPSPKRKGQPYITIAQPVRKIKALTGVSFVPHDLRRTAASQRLWHWSRVRLARSFRFVVRTTNASRLPPEVCIGHPLFLPDDPTLLRAEAHPTA